MTRDLPKNSKTIFSVAVGGILSFSLLYVFGNLGQIQAYSHASNIPTLKLFILNSILFLTLAFALYSLIREFFNFRPKQNIILFSVLVVSFLLSYQVMSIPDSEGHAVGFSYILVGNYLRDVHGINIYFMDWSGWAVTITIYTTIILSALIFEGFKRFLLNQFVDYKQKIS